MAVRLFKIFNIVQAITGVVAKRKDMELHHFISEGLYSFCTCQDRDTLIEQS